MRDPIQTRLRMDSASFQLSHERQSVFSVVCLIRLVSKNAQVPPHLMLASVIPPLQIVDE